MLLNIIISCFHRYLDGLQEAGRLTNPRIAMEGKGKEMADMLIQQGWIERCHWLDESRCLVPSATKDLHYLVVLPEYTCECVTAPSGGMIPNSVWNNLLI